MSNFSYIGLMDYEISLNARFSETKKGSFSQNKYENG